MRDFKKARSYYHEAIDNMNLNINGGAGGMNEEIDSKLQYVHAQELAQNKFVLACRYFSLGQALKENIKHELESAVREQLESKTREACSSGKDGGSYHSLRAYNSNVSIKVNPLSKSMEA